MPYKVAKTVVFFFPLVELNVNSVCIAYAALVTVFGKKKWGGKSLIIKGFEEKYFCNMGFKMRKQFKRYLV